MKILVLFYSRSGATRTAAKIVARDIGADIEEIRDMTDRSGPLGYLRAGRDAAQRKMTDIEPLHSDCADYDLIILGTPVWAFTMACAVRTVIDRHKSTMENVAFFCTMGGAGAPGTFLDMERLAGRKPIATLALRTQELKDATCAGKIKAFVESIRPSAV